MRRRIPSFSILLITAALSVLGALSLGRLSLQYKPVSPGQSITVSYSLRDASPELVEAEVTSKIEGVMSAISHCSSVRSSSGKGGGRVTVTFDKGTDMAAARFEVASAIRNISGKLPRGLSYPEISMGSGGWSTTALTYNIKSSLPSREIEKYVRGCIMSPIAVIDGVDGVRLSGVTPYEIEIEFDADKAASAGITASDIASAFRANFEDSVLGMTESGDAAMAVRLAGAGDSNFATIPVKNCAGRIVFLGDIARWSYREALPDSYFRINGLNTVTMSVSVTADANLLRVTRDVRRRMASLSESFPAEISASIAYDASEYMNAELRKIYLRTGLCLLILLLFVLVVTRSWRYLVITVATIAVNLLSAVLVYSALGLQVHIYTLAGITVSLGIIIDTSIVMIDHYARMRDRKAFGALVPAIGTTIVAVLLILLLPPGERLNLTDFIWVIVINLALSLAVSWFFVPALMDYLPLNRRSGAQSVAKLRRRVRARNLYGRYIAWGVRWRWAFLLLVVASMSSFLLFYKVLDRSNFYREPVRKTLMIHAGMLEGSSVHQLDEVVREMENYLASFDEISTFRTEVRSYDDAQIIVEFKPEYEHSGSPQRIKSLVTSMAINFGGANWSVYGIDQSYFNNNIVTNYKSNQVLLRGYNYADLLGYADILVDRLMQNRRVTAPEIWSGSYGRPSYEFNLEYDIEKMVAAGVDPYRYYDVMASRLYDGSITSILHDGEMTPVMLRSSDRDSYDLWHTLNAPLEVDSARVSLRNVGSMSKRRTGLDIIRQDQSYEISVQFDFVGSHELARKVTTEAVDYLNSGVLPVGFKAEVPDYGWSQEEKERYAWLIALMILSIYVILSMAFESLRLPFAVILMIPVSFVGVFLVFGLSNFAFDQGGFAAMVMLCGITVNAGIYLVHTYLGLGGDSGAEERGRLKARSRVYARAFGRKATPIFLTVVSTVLGLVPFLTDGPKEVFWFDFAVGTIAGMLMSVLAVVFLLPLFVVRRR